jgi:PAS domain S-box-containing protein
MEDALVSHAADDAAETERRSFILVRWMLVMSAGALLFTSALEREVSFAAVLLIVAFATSNILLSAYWSSIITRPGAEMLLAVLDTLFLGLSIALAAIATNELFVLSFLMVFLVAFGRNLRQIVAAGIAISFLYIWMSAQLRPTTAVLDPGFLVRIPFVYAVALYFGTLAARAGRERRQNDEVLNERRELVAIMQVLETINSTLDLHQVMLSITKRMAEAVGLERCSVLLVESANGRSLVLASSDSPEVDRLEIDLSRYPEVRRAIERSEPVLVQDVQNNPLMDGVRQFLSDAGFNTILVVPMIHQHDIVGTLLLRAASAKTTFSPSTVAFCEAIASASAHAVKNALLYRQVREESARHRATIEKLENVLQYSMDLIVATDLEGRITDFNRSAEKSLGYRRDEMLGEPLTRIYTSAGERSDFLSRLRGHGRIDDRTATMRARDGSGRLFDLTVSVVRNELGEVVGSVCVGKAQYAVH